MQSLSFYLKNPTNISIGFVTRLNFLFSDKLYLKILFRLKMGYRLDLKNPKTFSEKLQWLKLYNRKPEYTTMVDKYAVKKYVADKIGEEYIIPTLGVWDTPEEIDWNSLPNQFVLKTTHGGGGGGVVICKDKKSFDKDRAVKILKQSYKSDIYKTLREWPYKKVPKRIIAEQFLENNFSDVSETNDLPDYKFFCFSGEPKYCQVISGRNKNMSIDFYDKEWNHQPFHEPKNYPFAEKQHNKPVSIDDMWQKARMLSQGQPFLRVDFYEIEGKTYFGELTFFPTSGFGDFSPKEWDYKFGEMIKLSIK